MSKIWMLTNETFSKHSQTGFAGLYSTPDKAKKEANKFLSIIGFDKDDFGVQWKKENESMYTCYRGYPDHYEPSRCFLLEAIEVDQSFAEKLVYDKDGLKWEQYVNSRNGGDK